MTVLVDTGVLYAEHDTDASRHEVANNALDAVYDGSLGQPYISEYVYDEVVTLTLKRGESFVAAKQLGEKIRGVDPYPEAYELVHVTQSLFTEAIEIFELYDDQGLSFTDATLVAQARARNIDTVLSFDDDFDGIIDRTDPAAVAREHNA